MRLTSTKCKDGYNNKRSPEEKIKNKKEAVPTFSLFIGPIGKLFIELLAFISWILLFVSILLV
jgi:hypothetical protein